MQRWWERRIKTYKGKMTKETRLDQTTMPFALCCSMYLHLFPPHYSQWHKGVFFPTGWLLVIIFHLFSLLHHCSCPEALSILVTAVTKEDGRIIKLLKSPNKIEIKRGRSWSRRKQKPTVQRHNKFWQEHGGDGVSVTIAFVVGLTWTCQLWGLIECDTLLC